MMTRSEPMALLFAIATFVTPLLAGCSGSSPTRVEASIVASNNMNPDAEGRASPLVVRIYQLNSTAAFNSASFFSLYDRDKAELGDTLKGKDELELSPGQELDFKKILEPGVHFVGVLGGYRDIERASWRAASVVKTGETTRLRIDIAERAITIAEVK